MHKIDRIRAKLENVDAILITSAANIFFLSGFTGTNGILFITAEKLLLFTDSRYYIQAKNQSPNFEVSDISGAVVTACAKYNIKTLAFEGDMSFNKYESLKSTLVKIHLVDFTKELDDLRHIKSIDEIAKIQTAAKICDDGFAHILNMIKVGVSEKALALELEFYIRKNGADGVSFNFIIASGANSALPHAIPSEKKIENGDFVLFDFGGTFEGYCSDMTRTVVVGEPTDTQLFIYNTVFEAQIASLARVQDGAKCSDVDKVARDIIGASGYGDTFGHGLGHSLGVEIHEDPRLAPKCNVILQNNMVMTVEPGIYVEGVGGVRIEDTVVVDGDNAQILTKTHKNLIKI